MTDIAFHFNMPDKLAYSCRLLRKIYLSGATVAVTAEPALLEELDELLWNFSPTEFVPHCMAGASPDTLAATPVVLGAASGGAVARDVLLNLGARIPKGFENFARLIEVVSQSSEDLHSGRSRWKDYAVRGYDLKRHDLASQVAGEAGRP